MESKKPPEDPNYFELPNQKSTAKPVKDAQANETHPPLVAAKSQTNLSSIKPQNRMSNTKTARTISSATASSTTSKSTIQMRSKMAPSKPKKKSAKKVEKKVQKMTREKMADGDGVRSEQFRWRVSKLLGSGGFGDVYKVKKEKNADLDTQEYAMKTEMVQGNKRMLRLKIEVTVLRECHGTFPPNEKGRSNFVAFVDRGITAKFKFLVMGLVGPSLDDIRRTYLRKTFSRSTAMQTALQTLTSLKNLHSLGWLHRDIKPQNFAVGLPSSPFEDLIYMLDFGIARKIFADGSKQVKIPRQAVPFLGTPRFASRACHRCQEQGRKDDLETWLYMIFDLFDQKTLQWKWARDKPSVLKMKDKFFKHELPGTYKVVPSGMKKLVEYCNGMTYYDAPDYEQIDKDLATIAKDNEISLTKTLDWMGKISKKPEKVKKEGRFNSSSSSESSDNQQSGDDTTTGCTDFGPPKKKNH